MKDYLTTKQVAERLHISDARVRRLIIDGLIAAEKIGRDNFISESEITRFEGIERKVGRPRKEPNPE